ncbi:GbsR/MarR family transcriptional regulator [Barrientosiimonas humi]|uniref:GbsR/MarR family transcriptional regulator n=1 Tax=Barrientosiimonas humi TaxID=999931 RepID=UPI00370D21C2
MARRSSTDAARRRVLEQLAEEFARSGMNRMAARVFAALVVTDEGELTAAELAELLHASPAAISGAVRYLEQVEMIRRTRPLGSRRDVFNLTNDIWYEALIHRGSVIERWRDTMRHGADELGPGTRAGERMDQMADFFAFMETELPALLERWRASRSGPEKA